MECAAHTIGGCGGIPQAVGEEFVAADSVPEAPISPHAGLLGRAAGIMFLTPDGETLLLRRGDGGDFPRTFGLPGGHLEEGEDDEQAARRECLEETGYSYRAPLERLSVYGNFTSFIVRGVDKFEVKLSDESTGYVWCKLEDAPEPLHPGLSETFRIARASTELDVAELMRDGLLPSPQQFGNMHLFALRITGTGMSYRSKLDENVFRDPELFASDRFMQRCNGLPVVWDHPDKGLLDSDTFGSSVIGSIMLPYYVGGEVWGIARIMDSVAAEKMKSVKLSTSPGVSHTTQSEGDKVSLDGMDILLEGVPVLIDHLAVCELGVWDKGGPPQGVKIDKHEVQDMPDPVKTDSQTVATSAPVVDSALLGAFGALLTSTMQPLLARMDSFEKNMPAPPLKTAADSTEEVEKKARADAEEAEKKAKMDADEKEKEEAEEKSKMDAIKKDEDEGMFADAQAKCDSVANLFNQRAGQNLVGETLLAYRVRSLKPFQQHSKQWKDVNLSAITDSAIFANVEAAIYADAIAAARTYTGGKAGLREIRKTDRNTGRTIIEFAGADGEWMKPFAAPKRKLIAINKGS